MPSPRQLHLPAHHLEQARLALKVELAAAVDDVEAAELKAIAADIDRLRGRVALLLDRREGDNIVLASDEDLARICGVGTSRIRQVLGPAVSAGEIAPVAFRPRQYVQSQALAVLRHYGTVPRGRWSPPT